MFPSLIFYSLLHNFIIFPQFYYLPSSSSSVILYIFPSTTTSTLHRSHIEPTLNFFFQHCFVNIETIYHHRHISIVFSPPPHFYCSPPPSPPPHFYCFPFLLLIFIVFLPPPHFYSFSSKGQRGQNKAITFEFGLLGLSRKNNRNEEAVEEEEEGKQ